MLIKIIEIIQLQHLINVEKTIKFAIKFVFFYCTIQYLPFTLIVLNYL